MHKMHPLMAIAADYANNQSSSVARFTLCTDNQNILQRTMLVTPINIFCWVSAINKAINPIKRKDKKAMCV